MTVAEGGQDAILYANLKENPKGGLMSAYESEYNYKTLNNLKLISMIGVGVKSESFPQLFYNHRQKYK